MPICQSTQFLIYTIARSSAGVPITESTSFLWYTCSKIELPALPICQSTQFLWNILLPIALPVYHLPHQQVFSGIQAQKSNYQLPFCQSTQFLMYTIASSSVGVPITKSTGFLWHTGSKIELPALPIRQSTQFLWHTLLKELCRSADHRINSFFLAYMLKNRITSCFSVLKLFSLPINKSTLFFLYTSSFFLRISHNYSYFFSAILLNQQINKKFLLI